MRGKGEYVRGMNFERLFLVMVFMAVTVCSKAQVKHHCHSGTSGITSKSLSGITVLQCIGQGSVIGNRGNTKTTLRQGFLQPSIIARVSSRANASVAFKAFPNPFEREVQVIFEDGMKKNVVFSLFSASGERVYLERMEVRNTAVLRFPDMAGGFYILQAEVEGITSSFKLQKL
jgi:hypothetical protein